MKLTKELIQKLMKSVASTHDEELGCEECFDQLDQFAEMRLEGKNAAEAMPLVEEHLSRCGNCREEFEAFLDCLKANEEQ